MGWRDMAVPEAWVILEPVGGRTEPAADTGNRICLLGPIWGFYIKSLTEKGRRLCFAVLPTLPIDEAEGGPWLPKHPSIYTFAWAKVIPSEPPSVHIILTQGTRKSVDLCNKLTPFFVPN